MPLVKVLDLLNILSMLKTLAIIVRACVCVCARVYVRMSSPLLTLNIPPKGKSLNSALKCDLSSVFPMET